MSQNRDGIAAKDKNARSASVIHHERLFLEFLLGQERWRTTESGTTQLLVLNNSYVPEIILV